LCGKPDCVPALELFHDIEVKEAFLGRPVLSIADDVEFHYAAGYDYYSAWVVYEGIRQRIAVDLVKPVTVTGSPYGGMRPRHWSPERGGLITSLEDFEAFPWPRPGHGFLHVSAPGLDPLPLDEAMRQITVALRKGMGLILCTDGIFERFTKDMMGYETFCYTLFDEPELIWRMFATVGELWLALYEQIAALPRVSALWLADDVAFGQGLMFSRQLMREHLFPWYRAIGEVAARHDKPLLFHSDGDLRPILDDLITCGVKALQPIEPKAMDIVALKHDYGGRLCLVGNIDLGSTLTLGTPDDVRAEVRERIRTLAPGGGYCVGSSNSVTNYVPLPSFKAMLEATFEYGCYPIH
jgi:uroporphyrinogen decarboxylase